MPRSWRAMAARNSRCCSPRTEMDRALDLAEKLRGRDRGARSCRIAAAPSGHVTVSVGVASLRAADGDVGADADRGRGRGPLRRQAPRPQRGGRPRRDRAARVAHVPQKLARFCARTCAPQNALIASSRKIMPPLRRHAFPCAQRGARHGLEINARDRNRDLASRRPRRIRRGRLHLCLDPPVRRAGARHHRQRRHVVLRGRAAAGAGRLRHPAQRRLAALHRWR